MKRTQRRQSHSKRSMTRTKPATKVSPIRSMTRTKPARKATPKRRRGPTAVLQQQLCAGGSHPHGRRRDEKCRHRASPQVRRKSARPCNYRVKSSSTRTALPTWCRGSRGRGQLGEESRRLGEEGRTACAAGEPDAADLKSEHLATQTRLELACATRSPRPRSRKRSPPSRTTSPAAKRSPRQRSPTATSSRNCSRWGSAMLRLRVAMTAAAIV